MFRFFIHLFYKMFPLYCIQYDKQYRKDHEVGKNGFKEHRQEDNGTYPGKYFTNEPQCIALLFQFTHL